MRVSLPLAFLTAAYDGVFGVKNMHNEETERSNIFSTDVIRLVQLYEIVIELNKDINRIETKR